MTPLSNYFNVYLYRAGLGPADGRKNPIERLKRLARFSKKRKAEAVLFSEKKACFLFSFTCVFQWLYY